MKEKHRKLLNYLYQHKGYTEANELAKKLSVTTRSIQNYVREINKLCDEHIILSSYRGYCINQGLSNLCQSLLTESAEQEENTRSAVLLTKILSTPKINYYSLAEEMYISESLVSMELKKTEPLLKKYQLTLVRKHNQLEILGTEFNKRALMAQLIRDESNSRLGNLLQDEVFSSSCLSSDSADSELLGQIRTLLYSDKQIRFHDFGIQNILIHTLIMIDRISISLLLPVGKTAAADSRIHPAFRLAEKISALLSKQLSVEVPESEMNYLFLLISSNAAQIEDESRSLCDSKELIPPAYRDNMDELFRCLEKNYFLPRFSDDFVIRFTLHIMDWITRSKQGMTVKNTLADEVKKSYPLIYDMALYVAKLLSRQYELTIDDDECSFLVYHIGSYLLLHRNSKTQIRILVVYLNYNDFHLNALHLLEQRFQENAGFYLVSLSCFAAETDKSADLIVTLGNFELNSVLPVLHLHLLPTEQDLLRLGEMIKQRITVKKQAQLKQHITRYIREDLFEFNRYTSDEFQMIRAMSEHCTKKGLCGHAFQASVIERELLSSTAFMDGIAIPHSLEHNCKEPFFYVVINDRPMKWGDYQVQIILLIGNSQHDIEAFSEIFDSLIKILYEKDTLPRLLNCKNYNQFIDAITELIIAYED